MPRHFEEKFAQPTVFGLGLVALDVILDPCAVQPLLYSGGTCGNVLTILSYLGWEARPIARLAVTARPRL